jgi:hypothetical protein
MSGPVEPLLGHILYGHGTGGVDALPAPWGLRIEAGPQAVPKAKLALDTIHGVVTTASRLCWLPLNRIFAFF